MEEERTQRIETVEERAAEPAPAPRTDGPVPAPVASVTPVDQPVAYVSLGLTVGDGFKFGCGLVMAVAIAAVGLLVLASVVFLVASLVGLPVPIG
jgi:hypothetical protein